MIVLYRNMNCFSIFENPRRPNNNSLPSPLALILFVMIVIIFLGFVKTISKTSRTTKTDTSNSVIKKAKQTCYGWCFWFWNKSTRCREVTCQERQHRSLRCLVFYCYDINSIIKTSSNLHNKKETIILRGKKFHVEFSFWYLNNLWA